MRLRTACRSDVALARRRVPWNLVFYLAGDNDLAPHIARNLAELKEVGSARGRTHVLTCVDLVGKDRPCLQRLADGEVRGEHPLPGVDARADLRMFDPATLRAVLETARRYYPAERTFLVLGGHGAGWRGAANDIGDGADAARMLGLDALAPLLREFGVTGVGLDACRMGSYEVAWCLADAGVEAFVASQTLAPGEGWRYADWLRRAASGPPPSAVELCRGALACWPAPASAGRFFAAFDLQRFGPLQEAVEDLARAVVQSGSWQLRAALARASREGERDLLAFAEELAAEGRRLGGEAARFLGPWRERLQTALVGCRLGISRGSGEAEEGAPRSFLPRDLVAGDAGRPPRRCGLSLRPDEPALVEGQESLAAYVPWLQSAWWRLQRAKFDGLSFRGGRLSQPRTGPGALLFLENHGGVRLEGWRPGSDEAFRSAVEELEEPTLLPETPLRRCPADADGVPLVRLRLLGGRHHGADLAALLRARGSA